MVSLTKKLTAAAVFCKIFSGRCNVLNTAHGIIHCLLENIRYYLLYLTFLVFVHLSLTLQYLTQSYSQSCWLELQNNCSIYLTASTIDFVTLIDVLLEIFNIFVFDEIQVGIDSQLYLGTYLPQEALANILIIFFGNSFEKNSFKLGVFTIIIEVYIYTYSFNPFRIVWVLMQLRGSAYHVPPRKNWSQNEFEFSCL